MEKLYYDLLEFEENQYILIASPTGLRFVGLFNQEDPLLVDFVENYDLIKDSSVLEEYKLILLNYLSKNIKDLNFKFDLQGTNFQRLVWSELSKVEYGKTISYKELAERVGRPNSIRAVANAVGKNPLLMFIPCHRIIGSNGKLTGFRSGLDLKKKLLELES